MPKDRNSTEEIQRDVEFINDIISHVDTGDTSAVMTLLKDWRHELRLLNPE